MSVLCGLQISHYHSDNQAGFCELQYANAAEVAEEEWSPVLLMCQTVTFFCLLNCYFTVHKAL